MVYDQNGAFEEWPELHEKLQRMRANKNQTRQPNLSVEILNSLILQS